MFKIAWLRGQAISNCMSLIDKGTSMPEVNISGPSGRLEGRFHPQKNANAPVAIILHPHPKFGGTMNNRVVYNLHYCFFNLGFSCLRFNFLILVLKLLLETYVRKWTTSCNQVPSHKEKAIFQEANIITS